jgi:hypothetical protein
MEDVVKRTIHNVVEGEGILNPYCLDSPVFFVVVETEEGQLSRKKHLVLVAWTWSLQTEHPYFVSFMFSVQDLGGKTIESTQESCNCFLQVFVHSFGNGE